MPRRATPGSPGSSAYPPAVDRLIASFASLPGIGRRSAERLAFHVLKSPTAEAMALSEAIADVKRSVKHCQACFNFAQDRLCAVCADPRRDASTILVVEQPKDVLALEQTGMYRGVYHVLMGRLAPLEGIGPESLTVKELLARIDDTQHNPRGTPAREIILGLNPTLEGDGTALFLASELSARGVGVSRLARGLPAGGQLEFVSKAVLADAIEGRRPV